MENQTNMESANRERPDGLDRRALFRRFGKRPSFSPGELSILWAFRVLAYLTVGVTAAIIVVLLTDALSFFSKVSISEFLFSGISWTEYMSGETGLWDYLIHKIKNSAWDPFGRPQRFNILPLLTGSLMVALGSCAIAVPLGLGTAVYLTQYAPRRVREILGPIVEILGGIPTVVYGYFAVTAVTPFLKYFFPGIEVFNAMSASIVVGIGIMPMVSSLSAESLRLVPGSIRNAGYALGMRKFHVVVKIMIPAAASGIASSIILAFARAIGETMAVTLAAGQTPHVGVNYLKGIQTITAFIVQVSKGDAASGTLEYYTIYALGLTLFIITFIFNYLASRVVKRFREVYK